jgi:hypothetical protein
LVSQSKEATWDKYLENKVLMRIYRPKTEEAIKRWEIISVGRSNFRKPWEGSLLADERLLGKNTNLYLVRGW